MSHRHDLILNLLQPLDTYMLQFINPEQFRTYCQNGQIRLNSNIAVIDDDEQSEKALNI